MAAAARTVKRTTIPKRGAAYLYSQPIVHARSSLLFHPFSGRFFCRSIGEPAKFGYMSLARLAFGHDEQISRELSAKLHQLLQVIADFFNSTNVNWPSDDICLYRLGLTYFKKRFV